MIINYEEQSDVTLFLLIHQYNNILQEISPAVTEFQKVTTILNEKNTCYAIPLDCIRRFVIR